MIFCINCHQHRLTHLPLSYFSLLGTQKQICFRKMDEHPYFTESKDPKDSFSNKFLSKGKEKMVKTIENIYLNEITMNGPTIAKQNKLIAQLFQQIAEMRAEMDKTQDLTNLAVVAYTPTLDNDIPPQHFLLHI